MVLLLQTMMWHDKLFLRCPFLLWSIHWSTSQSRLTEGAVPIVETFQNLCSCWEALQLAFVQKWSSSTSDKYRCPLVSYSSWTMDWSVKCLQKAAPVLKSTIAPICDTPSTDRRMDTVAVFRQLILQSLSRPPASTLNATSPSLGCLFPICEGVLRFLCPVQA